jgi:cellulase/cellobiase CelA1
MLGQKSPPPTTQVPALTGPVCGVNSDITCDYVVQGEWDDGFNAAIRLYNGGSVPLRGWEVDWTYTDGSRVNQIWSAGLSGSNPYQATNLDWNRIINPGASVNFGMIGHKQAVHAQVPLVSGDICDTLQ